MKKSLCVLVLLVSPVVYGADWTPVFGHLQVGTSDDGVIFQDKLLPSIFKEGISERTKNPLTDHALTGKYSTMPMPYRADMLPAKFVKNKDDIALQATIPLKNATLFGHKITSLTYFYGCYDCDALGFYATFAPMSNQQYQALVKKVRFKTESACGEEEQEPVAEFDREQGVVKMHIYMGC